MSSPEPHLLDRRLDCEESAPSRRDKAVSHVHGSREAVRKRTFTRWINQHIKRCDRPLKVDELFTDVQDGKILMALLEELSGCKMGSVQLCRFRPSTHHIFRLSNIAKVLDFLEDRNIRVVDIEAADVAEGKPSVVLRLIWNIIVYFQLKEVTGNLEKRFSSVSSLVSLADSSDSSTRGSPVPPSDEYSSTLTLNRNRASSRRAKYHGRAIKTLLSWVQCHTALYGVEVYDFGKSWRNGLAFLALVKSARAELVDMRAALCSKPRQNITEAFRLAEENLGVPPLLDPEDVMVRSPDEQSIITYVAQFLECFPSDREYNVSTLSLEETFYSICDYSSSAPAFYSLEPAGDLNDCCDMRQKETASYSQSSAACNGSILDESGFQSRQFLNGSTKGWCWTSLSQEESSTVCTEGDGGQHQNTEKICDLSALDSDEEDAFRYILELDQEQPELQNESDLRLTLSTIINTKKNHQSLGVGTELDFNEANREKYSKNPSENKPQSLHHSDKVTTLCVLTDRLSARDSPELLAHGTKLHSKDKTDEASTDSTDLEDEDFHNKSYSDFTAEESLCVVESLKDITLREEDIELSIFRKNSVENENSLLQRGSPTHQTEDFLASEQTEKTSNTAKVRDECMCVGVSSDAEMLHKILLLWILVYCTFILRQQEFWDFFKEN